MEETLFIWVNKYRSSVHIKIERLKKEKKIRVWNILKTGRVPKTMQLTDGKEEAVRLEETTNRRGGGKKKQQK